MELYVMFFVLFSLFVLYVCNNLYTVIGGQRRWAPAYLAACHHICIILSTAFIFLWLIKLLLLLLLFIYWIIDLFCSVVKEYTMSTKEREKLSELIRKHHDNVTKYTQCWKWIVMMAVGGALILIAAVIAVIAYFVGKRLAVCCYFIHSP